jgi:hypothetical protein
MNGAMEDLHNHYSDGYRFGKADEAKRILTLVELDILIPDNVKDRIKDLVGEVDDGSFES